VMFCVLSHVETIGMKFDSKHKSSVSIIWY
jgi:hypothetical protein